MQTKRGFRWTLFAVAFCCFFWVVFVSSSPWAIALFFISGGGWYYLEQRKTRELDAPKPR